MSKTEEKIKNIILLWKTGYQQTDIAKELGVSNTYVSQILAPLKNPSIPISIVPQEIKRLFERIHQNLDKSWGLDNNYKDRKNKKHLIPKYKNLWEDWQIVKKFFDNL